MWSILNTYKVVNAIHKHSDAMANIGANMTATVSNDIFLSCGIFCNLSQKRNDIDKIISRLTPEWYQQQMEDITSKGEIGLFISDKLTYCPECMKNGYHSVLHQLKGITMCPFHPNTPLISYLKQRYVLGKQSPFKYDSPSGKRFKVFASHELVIRKTPIDFEDISSLPFPTDWNDMPEINDFFRDHGISTANFDYIKPIGTDIRDKYIQPNIGYFLLKDSNLKPNIIIYNREASDKLAIQKFQNRAMKCGIADGNLPKHISPYGFKYIFMKIVIVEMLKPFTDDEIDYKCYQIERGRFISCNDELGMILLFFIYLTGSGEVEDCLCTIKENNDILYKERYGLKYYSSDICVLDLNIGNLCISAQYYILDAYIDMNWKKFKEYMIYVGGMQKPINYNDLILHPDHMVYTEQNDTIRLYKC
jgi:hypothetical protein